MVKDIGPGMKASITKVFAARSFAVDPRNVYMLTSTAILWTWAGLTQRFGKKDLIPEDEVNALIICRKVWQDAGLLIKREESWEQATMRCHDVAVDCLTIAVANDLIDYDIFTESITDALFGGGKDSGPEETA